MKIYIGGVECCSVNNNSFLLKALLSELNGVEIVRYVNYADVIIFTDTCAGLYSDLSFNLDEIKKVLNYLKNGEQVYNRNANFVISGCIGNGFKYELTNEQKEILSNVTLVKTKDLLDYLIDVLIDNGIKEENDNFDNIVNKIKMLYKTPYTLFAYEGIITDLRFSPVTGCLNHCSFCAKTHFQNFLLNSIKYEDLENFKDFLSNFKNIYLGIYSSNLSLYGVDLYGKQRAHEVIKLFSHLENVKYICCGALINFYDELIDEIINNPKIKKIDISVESGSEKIYKLMNRPISFEKLKEVLMIIRKNRPDIVIVTELIAGFPGEEVDDIKRTISFIEEFGLYTNLIHSYNNSSLTKSHYLDGQHTELYIKNSRKYLKEKLDKNNEVIKRQIFSGECYVVNKDNESSEYLVMFPNESIEKVRFNQVDGEYEEGEVIPNVTRTDKEFAKMLKLG